MDELLSQALHITTRSMEALGVCVIVAGTVVAGVNFLRQSRRPGAYRDVRATLGRSILLGLELLVAADIINTVTVEPSLDRVVVLAGVILIRTFLSLSLEVEIDGRWPWRRADRRDDATAGS